MKKKNLPAITGEEKVKRALSIMIQIAIRIIDERRAGESQPLPQGGVNEKYIKN